MSRGTVQPWVFAVYKSKTFIGFQAKGLSNLKFSYDILIFSRCYLFTLIFSRWFLNI